MWLEGEMLQLFSHQLSTVPSLNYLGARGVEIYMLPVFESQTFKSFSCI